MSVNLNSPLVREFIVNNGGENAYKILKSLNKGKTDEQISRSTKMDVNEIRAHLNKLHFMGIITYSKIKAKTSNWYTYTWFVEKDRIGELLKERYATEIDDLKKKLEFEQNYTFFKCSNGCKKEPFEIAYEYDFKCPDCGSPMGAINTNKEKKQIETKIKQIETFLKR
jgi:transcription initiation factor TFIIE subunit alpha